MHSFAFAAVLCMALVAASASEFRTECRELHGVTEDDVKVIQNRAEDAEYPEKVQCYLKCVAEKLGVFKDGKTLDAGVEGLLKSSAFDANLADERYGRYPDCKDKSGANDCETAAKIYKCVFA